METTVLQMLHANTPILWKHKGPTVLRLRWVCQVQALAPKIFNRKGGVKQSAIDFLRQASLTLIISTHACTNTSKLQGRL